MLNYGSYVNVSDTSDSTGSYYDHSSEDDCQPASKKRITYKTVERKKYKSDSSSSSTPSIQRKITMTAMRKMLLVWHNQNSGEKRVKTFNSLTIQNIYHSWRWSGLKERYGEDSKIFKKVVRAYLLSTTKDCDVICDNITNFVIDKDIYTRENRAIACVFVAKHFLTGDGGYVVNEAPFTTLSEEVKLEVLDICKEREIEGYEVLEKYLYVPYELRHIRDSAKAYRQHGISNIALHIDLNSLN